MSGSEDTGADTVVAVDVGGTSMKGAVVTRAGAMLCRERRDTRREQGASAVVDAIGDFAADLSGQARARTGRACAAVGVAVPGLVDEQAGIALYSANLGWKDVRLRDLLERRLGGPVALCHDVRAGAVVEGLLGAARDVPDYLFLTLGTGIGATMMIGGRPYAGARGRGGELGHISVDPNGPICGCGNQGCVEAIASAAAVAERYRWMSGGAPDVAAPTPEAIAERSADDPVAGLVWQQAIDALAQGITSYVALMDPDLVVVGGGMANAGEALFRPLRFRLAAQVKLREAPPVRPAVYGEHAGRTGAALGAWLANGVRQEDLDWQP